MVDLTQILTTLSHQITNQNQAIQDHILQNDIKFHQVVQDNEDFKCDIRTELDSIRQMITNRWTALNHTPNSTSLFENLSPSLIRPTQSMVFVPVTQGPSTAGNSNLFPMPSNSSGNDFQNPMMMMLTELFSKLSSALWDKKEDTSLNGPSSLVIQKKSDRGIWLSWLNFPYLHGNPCTIQQQIILSRLLLKLA